LLICETFYRWKKDTGTHPSKVKMRFVLTTNSIICNLRWKTLLMTTFLPLWYYKRWILVKSIWLADCVKVPLTCSSSAVSISRPVISSIRWLIFSIVECSYPDSQALEWGEKKTRNWRKVKQLYTKATNIPLHDKQTSCHTMHMIFRRFHILFSVKRFLKLKLFYLVIDVKKSDCDKDKPTGEAMNGGKRN